MYLGSDVISDDVKDDGVWILARVRILTGLHLPERHSERIDVGLGPRCFTSQQFRRAVGERTGKQGGPMRRTHPASITLQQLAYANNTEYYLLNT